MPDNVSTLAFSLAVNASEGINPFGFSASNAVRASTLCSEALRCKQQDGYPPGSDNFAQRHSAGYEAGPVNKYC